MIPTARTVPDGLATMERNVSIHLSSLLLLRKQLNNYDI